MSKRTRHIREFVETLTGPVVYLAFFTISYFATSLVCVLSRGEESVVTSPAAVTVAVVLGFALLALLALGKVIADASRLVVREGEDREDVFMGWMTLVLAALSVLAVIWTALPAATIAPVC